MILTDLMHLSIRYAQYIFYLLSHNYANLTWNGVHIIREKMVNINLIMFLVI